MHRKKTTLRMLTLLLVVVLMLPTGAAASMEETVQPRASLYLSSYSGYIYQAGGGKVQACFSVKSGGYRDEIGAVRIAIYESTDNSSFTWVKTFTSVGTPSLMDYNDYAHSGYVTYQGVAGRYYKAYMCVYAGDDGVGDTRYFWTSVKKAT